MAIGPSKTDISRRTIATSAAWTAPAIVVASAAPRLAASACEPGSEVTIRAQPASTTGTTAGRKTTTLPDDVTTFRFDITGGGGGAYGAGAADAHKGGSGQRITGTITVPAGATIELVGGQGGAGPLDWNDGQKLGGEGFGDGGNTGAPDLSFHGTQTGGSGGGGSALLVNGVAMVIAGGGGGSAGQGYIEIVGGPGITHNQANGGDAEKDGDDYSITRTNDLTDRILGSGGAVGATPGEPRDRTRSGGVTNNSFAYVAGVAGAPGSLATGGKGADGVVGRRSETDGGDDYQIGSAGGGGGYAGGASGTALARDYTSPAGNQNDYNWVASGTGGGGSNYVDPSVTVEISEPAGNGGDNGGVRPSGFAELVYETCAEENSAA